MKTKDFIRACATGSEPAPRRNGWKMVASIGWDGKHIYSYGTHYPLLIAVDLPGEGKTWICNDAGYSSTTSRHIGQARQYAAGSVHIPRGWSGTTDPERIREAARLEIKECEQSIVALNARIAARPHYNSVYQNGLTREKNRIENLLNVIRICEIALATKSHA